MNRLLVFISISILILISSKGFAQKDALFVSEISPMQKEIVARLTGKIAIKDSIFLTQRASPEERKMTVDYLSSYLLRLGLKIENHHYKTTAGNLFLDLFFNPLKGVNVVGKLKATIPSEEYVIFGGHYDSERGSPGAIDNATGIALSIGIIKKLIQLEERHINFMIVFFDQEEDGNLGSKAFASYLKKEKIKVHSVHSIDMLGWDENNDRSFEIDLPAVELEKIYNVEADKNQVLVNKNNLESSDHKSFVDQGFTTVGVSEDIVKGDTTPHYHKSSDTYDTVNFDYLGYVTYIIYRVMLNILDEVKNNEN